MKNKTTTKKEKNNKKIWDFVMKWEEREKKWRAEWQENAINKLIYSA